MLKDPTTRFTDRVEAYLRYRPTYPAEMIDLLKVRCGLQTPQPIADIGSGTGILTRLFLERGHRVWGVEPNRAMRSAAERWLSDFRLFTSISGTAENTSLVQGSVHLIASAQAFHWFQVDRSWKEFRRILRPDGWVAVIWNDRRKTSTPFLRGYEQLLLTHGTDYEHVDHTRIGEEEIGAFFGSSGFHKERFDNRQILDFNGLQGRLESSSYAPSPGDPSHRPMLDDLRNLFRRHNTGGSVTVDYDTVLYYGQMKASGGR